MWTNRRVAAAFAIAVCFVSAPVEASQNGRTHTRYRSQVGGTWIE